MPDTRVRWLPDARQDIRRLYVFLKDKNPLAAQNAISAIRAGATRLQDFPRTGHLMDENTRRRELFLPVGGTGYVLRYMLDGKDVVIIRVWHAREKR